MAVTGQPESIHEEMGLRDLRTPPHSVEAEQAVLGGLMLDNSAWDKIADVVVGDDFYRRDHRLIYEAIGEMVERGDPCDAVTLSEHLERSGKLDQVGGLAYLGGLSQDTPTAANVRAYANIVRERSLLRGLIRVGGEIADSGFNPDGQEASALVEDAERRVYEIAESGRRTGKGFIALKSLLPNALDRLDTLFHSEGDLTGVSTGFEDMDRMTAGLQKGDLIVIAGRPSMGKTSFAMNMAEHAAIRDGVPTAIFSMEMSSEQLAFRMISSLGRVNQARLRTGNFNDEDWPRINSAVALMSNAQLFIDDTPGLTPTELRARSRRLKREHGLGLVVVDYLQLMQVAGTKENRATEISEISRGLKALAKELEVPVIALSQLNRSVEQRHDKKPVMSDLRECVTGDTLVCLTDGRRVPIQELVGRKPRVWAVDERHRLVPAQADAVWPVAEREVLELKLASGRVLRGTAEHRVLTGAGWQTLGELAVGDRVGLAARIPTPEAELRWSDLQVALLGQLVGDGSYLKGAPLRYTTASEENSRIVTEAAESLGSTVKRYEGRGNWHQLLISGNGSRWQASGVGGWLKGLGIFGQRSHEKRLPVDVFRLGDDQVGVLLRHLWATDGSIHVRPRGQRGAPRVYFSTCSEFLARDVAALLLRLGIVARIRSVRDTRGTREVWTVDVSGTDAQRRFLDRVGAFGPRCSAAEALSTRVAGSETNTNVDTLPVEVFETVRAEMAVGGVTTRGMAALRGTSYGGSSHFRFAPSRKTLASYADLLDSDALRQAVDSDLFWDRVVGIDGCGTEQVFDLTVPGPACWLADGLVTHNSGAIEQDADIISFIYREEVYDKETSRKGIADIIIAKQRNGPTGEIHLTFLGEYTKFENFTPDTYGQGGYG